MLTRGQQNAVNTHVLLPYVCSWSSCPPWQYSQMVLRTESPAPPVIPLIPLCLWLPPHSYSFSSSHGSYAYYLILLRNSFQSARRRRWRSVWQEQQISSSSLSCLQGTGWGRKSTGTFFASGTDLMLVKYPSLSPLVPTLFLLFFLFFALCPPTCMRNPSRPSPLWRAPVSELHLSAVGNTHE